MRPPLRVAALLFVVGFLPCPASEFRVAMPIPEAVEKNSCRLPGNMQLTTGHFLARYLIEPEGSVSKVEAIYAAIEPATDEPRVEDVIRQCMSRWRYKNAVVPTPAMTAFHFFAPGPPKGPTVEVSEGVTLSLAQIEEMRRAKVEFARHLLSGEEFVEYDGTWWTLRTDTGKRGLWEFRDSVEFARQAFESLFPGRTPVKVAPMSMLVFRDPEQYKQVSNFDNLYPNYYGNAGHYSRWDQMVYTVVEDLPLSLVGRVLTHEAAHHLFSQAFWTSDRPLPRWVDEGVASFIECLRQGRKKIRLDKLDTRMHQRLAFVWPPQAEQYISSLQFLSRNGALPSLQELLDGEAAGALSTMYAYSWLVVQFLVNGSEGAYLDAFRGWLADQDAGTDAASLEAALGRTIPELEAGLHEYLKQL